CVRGEYSNSIDYW
nr:immunoglobulin heavy chain junction region [Macaca mulatta]MOV39621.1 immunoglobulin heavy chain junction region [Macaca mulatta]